MHVVSLDGLPAITTDRAEEPNLHVFLGVVGGHLNELLTEERSLVEQFSNQRQEEFASGRRLAHYALQEAGSTDKAVMRDDRRPIWPANFIGSISHSDHLAACALSNPTIYDGVGIDLAKISAVSEYVANRVLDDDERHWIHTAGSTEWRTALFSAKEAVYKSVNPITSEYLGFRDVTVQVSADSLTFSAVTTSAKQSQEVVSRGRGYFHRVTGHWLTTFVVPVSN